MTRSELVAALASRFPQLHPKDAGEASNEILGAISRTLSAGHRVEIRGFGSFSLNYQAPRLRRNPKTAEIFLAQGKHVPHFKAGKELRGAVDCRANQQVALKKAA
jgi:integration host factor subunit beta